MGNNPMPSLGFASWAIFILRVLFLENVFSTLNASLCVAVKQYDDYIAIRERHNMEYGKMELNSAAIEQRNNLQLFEIRKVKSDFASTNDYLLFRDELMSKAINPWLKEVYQRRDSHEEAIPKGVWALIAYERNDVAMNASVLLDFVELDFDEFPEAAQNFDNVMWFTDWVAHFDPNTWGDWLMVPKFYPMYLRTGNNLPVLSATPDPWIDGVLRESRGILMWTHQFIQIVRMVASVGITEATRINSSFFLRKPGSEQPLEKIYLPTKQTLLQIFEERTVGMQCLGSPDYILADWLSKYPFEKVVKMDV